MLVVALVMNEWVFVLSAGRKLSSANLFGDSNFAVLKQSNNVNNKQGAFFGKCDGSAVCTL